MTHPEHPHDAAVTRELRDSLSCIGTSARPSIEVIETRGRARQRRRATGLAGVGTACAAVAAVAAVGLSGSPSPSHTAGTGGAISTGTIRTDAFTLTRNANGTDTLTLNQAQMFNPAELQKALARDGIAALVKINTDCRSTPPLPSPMPVGLGVVSIQLPDGTPVGPPASPGHPGPSKTVIPRNAVNVIDPARMPAGSELFFDYVRNGLTVKLINAHSYTCRVGEWPFGAGR